jgi:pyruvate dehydrogenase E1 component beta subunit
MSTTTTEAPPAGRQLPYLMAIPEAIAQCMREDPDIFLAGEDVAGYGGVFGTTRGLLDEFGAKRVVDTPISEAGLVGLGVGAAAVGLRPIIEIMFMDFIGHRHGPARQPDGQDEVHVRWQGEAADHDPHDGRRRHVDGGPAQPEPRGVALPRARPQGRHAVDAVRRQGPARGGHPRRQPGHRGGEQALARADRRGPEELYEVPLGVARVAREGTDATVVATGRMVGESLAAAEALAADGIEVEVVDPRTLSPLDLPALVTSVRKTNRCVVVHEAVRFAGFGAEIAAAISEEAFDHLDAPVARVGAPFSPVPFSPVLEKLYVPDAARIAAEVRGTLGR